MRPAAAYVAVHPANDLILCRIRLTREQRDGRHDHAGGAVAALHGVLLGERLLDAMQRAGCGREPFNRHYALPLERADGRDARPHSHSVDEHRAGAALPLTAAVFGPGEAELGAEHRQQRFGRRDVDTLVATVDLQSEYSHGGHMIPVVRLKPDTTSCRGPAKAGHYVMPGSG